MAMDRENDYTRFTVLMATLAEATPGKDVSAEKVEIYFRLLEDIPYEIVEHNALEAVRRKGFFPLISDIRNEKDFEMQALEDFDYVMDLVSNFCFTGFGQSGDAIIDMKLKESGKEYLHSFIRRWGMELAYTDNPTATRAQALKVLKVEVQRRHEELPEPVKLKELCERSGVSSLVLGEREKQ